MPYTFTIIAFLLCTQLDAQVVKQPLSVKYTGLGAYSSKFSDIFSATSNQAALTNLRVPAFGVYGERRFMLAELMSYSAIVGLPTASGSFGFQADYFGSSVYNESQLGAICARKLSAHFDIGLKFNYYRFKVAGYGSQSAINFEMGALFHLNEKLHLGLHAYNPSGSRLGKSGNEKLAMIYSLGLGYEASDKLFISTELVKQENLSIGINAGLQYNLHTHFFIRTGISTISDVRNVSVGVNIGFARIDINAAYHSQLGFTPGILLLFNLKKAESE